MKGPRSEWLLLPVFVLPLAAAAALALWARSDYFARTEPFRRDGDALARRWIERDAGRVGWIAGQFLEALPRPRASDAGWVPFRHPAGAGFVRVEDAAAGTAPWELGAEWPKGLRPKALADANLRLAVETGAAPGRQPGVDAGTAAFVALGDAPDAASLRAAPLPASTKRYLLARRFGGGTREDARTLDALAAFERLAAADPRGLATGAHRADGFVVLGSGGGWLVCPQTLVPSVGSYVVAEGDDGDVRLLWSAAEPAVKGDVAWTADLEAPLAGCWTFDLPRADRWWESGSFTRRALPAAIGCLAFLSVPAALAVALGRRRRLDEARARFVNELAHDLRTPVTSLRLHAEMLSDGRVPEGEEARYLGVVGREAARLSALLANLLDLSRLERGSREFDAQRLGVAEIAGDAVRDFSLIHPKRAADVTLDVASGVAVRADRHALARCLANLLDNAGKFTPAGTPIRVSAASDGASAVRIVVADEGEGVATADRGRVFGLYARGRSATATAAPGTGLGLALVRELVQGMGGRVALLDVPRGAAFEIRLPEAADG